MMNNKIESDDSLLEQKLPKPLRKKQQREERKKQQEQVRLVVKRKKQIRLVFLWSIPVLLIILVGWVIIRSSKIENSTNALVSRQGIHWHPNMTIMINDEKRDIPANVGIGGVHKDIHTHQTNDVLHVEVNRAVRQDDIRIKNFFDIWGERFTSECIFDVCNSDDGVVKMLVNGEENLEFENYLMQEGDRIEIVYK